MDTTNTTTALTNAVSLPGQGRGQAVMGVTQIYKLEAQQSAGNLVCLEITVPPGEGIPLHAHRDEEEYLYVITGCVAVEGEDLPKPSVNLEAGSFFYGPRGLYHGFHCVGMVAAKILVFITPGARSQEMFAELAELTRVHGTRLDPAVVGAVAREYGITVGPPT
jgi:quercetin dioxygenase-like cupin family protein